MVLLALIFLSLLPIKALTPLAQLSELACSNFSYPSFGTFSFLQKKIFDGTFSSHCACFFLFFFHQVVFFLQILELRLISSCNLYSLEEWCQQYCIIPSGICSLIAGEEVEKIYKKVMRKLRKITAHVGGTVFKPHTLHGMEACFALK